MLRLIYLFLIDFFIGISINYFFEFNYVKCKKKIFHFDNILPKISNKNINFKQQKKYFFLPKNCFTKKKNILKNKNFKYHKGNNIIRGINNYDLLNFSHLSFFKLRKFKIFNNTENSNYSENNESEHEKDKNLNEKNEEWKNFLEDKRKKEILKDLENKIRKNRKVQKSKEKKDSDNKEDFYFKNDEDENEDEDDEYDDDDDEDEYDEYDDEEDNELDYFYNDNEENKYFDNNKKSENIDKNKFPDDKKDISSINDNINNFFTSKKKNDFPLFFSLNNKPFENSNNKYFDKICSISPNELINRFFENTSERVKEAVKTTIFNIIGNIQKYTIETSILITYDKIYNFLLQIILTGYMIKNADYRLSLNESLYDQNNTINKKGEDSLNLKKSFYSLFVDNDKIENETLDLNELSKDINFNNLKNKDVNTKEINENDYNYNENEKKMNLNGHYFTKYKEIQNDDFPIINTKNYIIFLRKKINYLENQLKILKENKTFLNDDLLSYIKSLTDVQLRSLTDNIGGLVLDATKKIVELVIQGMTLNINKNLSNELIYVSGSVLTYICFWQLIIGYTLREMEIRDELSDYLKEN
ncbi:conserved Plasmodium protein, unknown function [Plasmodium gallinaceum]|uniref:Uncharacterized protein n=1 Tax=Plasmodium gallinaceum TaxID=5849 RepID=A0A1J1GL35_PLAGA|nr:conserved Plasmodium protein, unknown function [Plasmodium gallinaceum]CRG93036.1 conserved Plasmodium protein, unknown function [Plasmodium gallinaceum]